MFADSIKRIIPYKFNRVIMREDKPHWGPLKGFIEFDGEPYGFEFLNEHRDGLVYMVYDDGKPIYYFVLYFSPRYSGNLMIYE